MINGKRTSSLLFTSRFLWPVRCTPPEEILPQFSWVLFRLDPQLHQSVSVGQGLMSVQEIGNLLSHVSNQGKRFYLDSVEPHSPKL